MQIWSFRRYTRGVAGLVNCQNKATPRGKFCFPWKPVPDGYHIQLTIHCLTEAMTRVVMGRQNCHLNRSLSCTAHFFKLFHLRVAPAPLLQELTKLANIFYFYDHFLYPVYHIFLTRPFQFLLRFPMQEAPYDNKLLLTNNNCLKFKNL